MNKVRRSSFSSEAEVVSDEMLTLPRDFDAESEGADYADISDSLGGSSSIDSQDSSVVSSNMASGSDSTGGISSSGVVVATPGGSAVASEFDSGTTGGSSAAGLGLDAAALNALVSLEAAHSGTMTYETALATCPDAVTSPAATCPAGGISSLGGTAVAPSRSICGFTEEEMRRSGYRCPHGVCLLTRYCSRCRAKESRRIREEEARRKHEAGEDTTESDSLDESDIEKMLK